MKKNIYLVFALLSFSTSMAIQKVPTNMLVASILLVSNKNYDKTLSHRLFHALKEERYTVAEKLIKNPKLDVNLKLKDGYRPLMWCFVNGDKYLSIVKLLLQHPSIDVNTESWLGYTPLTWCCDKADKYLAIAKLLLEHPNIDVNAESGGDTPLTYCCDNLNPTLIIIAKLLLKNPNIDINLKDCEKNTPLDIITKKLINGCASENYVKLWNILVEQGALLDRYRKFYQKIKSNRFKEPYRTYVHLIKQRPPSNCTNNHFMYSEEETKEDA